VSKTFNFSTASSDFRLSLSNLPLFPRKVGGSKFEVAGFLASCWHLMRTLCNDTPLCQNKVYGDMVMTIQSNQFFDASFQNDRVYGSIPTDCENDPFVCSCDAVTKFICNFKDTLLANLGINF